MGLTNFLSSNTSLNTMDNPSEKPTSNTVSTVTTQSSDITMSSVNDDNRSSSFEEKLHRMLEELTEAELELAARTSYEYQQQQEKIKNQSVLQESNHDDSYDEDDDYFKEQTQDLKKRYAMIMARRYLTSKSDVNIALEKLKGTLVFRNEMQLDNIRQLTARNNNELYQFLSDKKAYVQGYDKDGRSTYIFIPRLVTDHSKSVEYSIRGHVWSLEKALACTKSIDQTINVVVDFNQFSLYYHSPPFELGTVVMTTLRNHYVGSINKIFLLNVPTAFTILWNLFKSFAGTSTRDKIVIVDLDDNIICEYYKADQATEWMLPNIGQKKRPLNVDEYLNGIPFDQAFDE